MDLRTRHSQRDIVSRLPRPNGVDPERAPKVNLHTPHHVVSVQIHF